MQNSDKDYRIVVRNITLLSGSTITVMASSFIAPALPQISAAFQDVPHVDFIVKQLLTIHALFIAICAPLIGISIDRWGRKPVLIAGVVLYGFAGSAGFMLDSLYAILASRVFLGVAIASILSSITTLIGDYYSGSELNSLMGLQAAFMGFGGVVFLTLAGILSEIDWRFTFLIYLIAFLILPGIVIFIEEPQTAEMPGHRKCADPKSSLPINKLILIYVLAFFGMLVSYIVPVELPFLLKSLEDISNTQIGLALSIQIFVSSMVSLQYRMIRAHFSFQKIFMFFFILMGIGYLTISLVSNYCHVLLGLIIAGAGFGLLMPNGNAWLASFVPPDIRGRVVGGFTTCFLAGQFFSPFIIHPVVSKTGISGTFGLVGGFLLFLSLNFGVANLIRKKSA